MFEITILIPSFDNDSKGFTKADHLVFEVFVVERFGAISLIPGLTSGAWSDEGRTYHDSLLNYVIALPSILKAGKLNEVVEFAKSHYRQEAIYIRYLGLSEVL